MKSFSTIYASLRRKNLKQYGLLAGCCFFSVLLTTAYMTIMASPTVQDVLPIGGDSRKQIMMIFVLTVVGCAVFTLYALSLFLRFKSREAGLYLALGAAKKQVKRELRKELLILSASSCLLGALLGSPLAWAIWSLFRKTIVDTKAMTFRFSMSTYYLSLAFSAFVIISMLILIRRFMKRTNIIDIISESHKNETMPRVHKWYGIAGILLTFFGAAAGYLAPGFIINNFHWYPPEGLTAILYIPALFGIYMLLLHTIVNGWRHGKNRYKNIVSTSMMRFQGHQTVLNMLVVTLLIAGAYFAVFYIPMQGTASSLAIENQKSDFAFHYRCDQPQPAQAEIENLAQKYNVEIRNFRQQTGAILGYDGFEHIEKKEKVGISYSEEYRECVASSLFLPESAYNKLTGDNIDLKQGEIAVVIDDEGYGRFVEMNISVITNWVTGQKLPVTPIKRPMKYSLLFDAKILSDEDYASITEGLPNEWLENHVMFDVKDKDSSYEFAKSLFNEIVDRSGPEVEMYAGWDPIRKDLDEAKGNAYFLDNEEMMKVGETGIHFNDRDSSEFRLNWKYMPSFSILDQQDLIKTMAVFFMLFIFVAIICFGAVFVILFTRSITIALLNERVYSDLRHLGASRKYLCKTVKGQISKIFIVPSIVGTILIMGFYALIMYFNDGGRISYYEAAGFGVSFIIVAAVSILIYIIYRLTLRKICTMLHI